MHLYIATSNPGKLRDFAYAASTYPRVTLEPLPNLDRIAPPDEIADTFRGNALIKADAYSALVPSVLVVADDSGIELPALDGAPGVRSARYAADREPDQSLPNSASTDGRSTDERNNAALLAAAARLEGDQRRCTYRCVLAAVRGRDLTVTAEGELTGTLLTAPRGTGGFGYDPLFYLPELGLTMAEIDPETRLRLSHRGRALRALLEQLLHPVKP